MGNNGAKMYGMEEAPVSLDDSCDGQVKVIDAATKETHGGRFWRYDGETAVW